MGRKFRILLWITSALCMCSIIIMAAYAWYVYQNRIGKIDAETKDISFNYSFDSSDELNEIEKSFYNVSFFDIDSVTEIKYAGKQAIKVKLNLKNTTKSDMPYTITYKPIEVKKYLNGATVTTNPESTTGMTLLSDAYIDCYISSTNNYSFPSTSGDTLLSKYLVSTDANDNGIKDYREYSGTISKKVGTTDGTDTVYLYLFGVQLYDNALNKDFISDTYSFNLIFNATALESDPDVEENTSTVEENTTTEETTEVATSTGA